MTLPCPWHGTDGARLRPGRPHSDGGLARHLGDVVHPVVLAQGEQALRLGGERVHGRLGLSLAEVDAVLIPARPDLRPLGSVGRAHRRGERRVEFLRQPVQLGHRGAARLRAPHRDVGRACRVEQLAALRGRGDVRRVLVESLLAGLVHSVSCPVCLLVRKVDYASALPPVAPAPALRPVPPPLCRSPSVTTDSSRPRWSSPASPGGASWRLLISPLSRRIRSGVVTSARTAPACWARRSSVSSVPNISARSEPGTSSASGRSRLAAASSPMRPMKPKNALAGSSSWARRRPSVTRSEIRAATTASNNASLDGKCRYTVPGPTPARAAISSRGTP